MTPTPPSKLLAILAICATVPSGQAALVFADDFSEPDGTEIIGKAPDVGGNWTGTAPTISNSSFDTSGGAREAFSEFTAELGVNEVLTLTYDSLAPSTGEVFGDGFAGVSLFANGGNEFFTGSPGNNPGWGAGGQDTTDTTVATNATLQYFFDTGAWTFTTGSGVNLSGSASSELAFDELRVANNFGGDIRVDNLQVDISPIPEPSTSMAALVGLACLGLRRRRA